MNERIQYHHNVILYIDLEFKCNFNFNDYSSFVGIDGIIQKSIKKCKAAKTIFQKKNNLRRLRTSDFKASYKVTLLNRPWHW